jgi:hypothetical protein
MGFDMFIWNLILDIEYPVRDRAGYDGTPTSCGLSQHFFPLPPTPPGLILYTERVGDLRGTVRSTEKRREGQCGRVQVAI